jgi:hypothetical protein
VGVPRFTGEASLVNTRRHYAKGWVERPNGSAIIPQVADVVTAISRSAPCTGQQYCCQYTISGRFCRLAELFKNRSSIEEVKP